MKFSKLLHIIFLEDPSYRNFQPAFTAYVLLKIPFDFSYGAMFFASYDWPPRYNALLKTMFLAMLFVMKYSHSCYAPAPCQSMTLRHDREPQAYLHLVYRAGLEWNE